MKTLRTFAITALALVCGIIAWIWLAFPAYTHRYRLTVEVEIDNQVKSGSSVIEVRWQKEPEGLSAFPWSSSIKGQAPLIDLGRYGVLLAPLGGGLDRPVVPADFLALRAFGHFPNRPRTFPPNADGLRALSRFQGRAELRPDNMPLLVWLPDPANRMSARPIGPAEFPSVIAPTIRFRGVWIETTDTRVTNDLATKLPWLRAQYQTERERGIFGRYGEYQLGAHSVNRGMDP